MVRRLKGLSADELKEARTALQKDLLRGKRIISTGAGNVNAAFTLVRSAEQAIDEINAELASMGEEDAADVVRSEYATVKFT